MDGKAVPCWKDFRPLGQLTVAPGLKALMNLPETAQKSRVLPPHLLCVLLLPLSLLGEECLTWGQKTKGDAKEAHL